MNYEYFKKKLTKHVKNIEKNYRIKHYRMP